jgi:DNA-directed RNA polymerase subunit omega
MMIDPRIEDVRDKADSRYTLVILAAKRARDLIDGKPALIEDDQQKPVSIASHEIAEDLITYQSAPAEDFEAEAVEAEEL